MLVRIKLEDESLEAPLEAPLEASLEAANSRTE